MYIDNIDICACIKQIILLLLYLIGKFMHAVFVLLFNHLLTLSPCLLKTCPMCFLIALTYMYPGTYFLRYYFVELLGLFFLSMVYFLYLQDVVQSLKEKLNIKRVQHFNLVLQNMKSHGPCQMTLLQEHETLAEVGGQTPLMLSLLLMSI